MLSDSDFDGADLARLSARGIPAEEARRQLSLLRRPPGPRDLLRPCTVGDGILRIDDGEMPELVHLHEEAARAGRLLKFVPASGAATRMFQDLLAFREAGVPRSREEIETRAHAGENEAQALATFLAQIRRFAFFEELGETLSKRGRDLERLAAGSGALEILEALLGPDGLGYAQTSKGLIEFHRYGTEARTAFEEHLVEAAALVRGGDGACRLHFTVSAGDRDAFEAVLKRARSRHERKRRARFRVEFSAQDPSTDTIALDGQGRPFRDEDGQLLLRPGGHGSLLENLDRLGADVVHVKNIDNVAREESAGRGILWRRLLIGLLVKLQREQWEHLRRLARGGDAGAEERARDFARRRLLLDVPELPGATGEAEHRRLAALLRRPLRICGVVRNTGEPGGAPFWVRDRERRASLQIVEAAEVDAGSESQRRIFASSTHFNPVDLVCGTRDSEDRPIPLLDATDADAVILTRKSFRGRELVALERPGLWNGAMAGWNTVFVEVPGDTFTPVKTFLDLLREEHQPA